MILNWIWTQDIFFLFWWLLITIKPALKVSQKFQFHCPVLVALEFLPEHSCEVEWNTLTFGDQGLKKWENDLALGI